MMVFAFSLAAPDVHAKKFGGSKSFGKSYKTAPQKHCRNLTIVADPEKTTFENSWNESLTTKYFRRGKFIVEMHHV